MTVYPQNFDLLAGGEDKIRQLSKAAIEASEDLSLHARMALRLRLSPATLPERTAGPG
jgi:hypothetical protein